MELKAEIESAMERSVKKEEAASKKVEVDDKENLSKPAVKEEMKPSTTTTSTTSSLNPLAKFEPSVGTINSKLPLSEVKDKNDNIEVNIWM